MNDDNIIYLLLGMVLGAGLGMLLYKNLFAEKPSVSAKMYGYQYTYDDQGHLTGYIPIPAGAT